MVTLPKNRGVVLVTGGAGYIGSHTCKALYEEGFCPVVYDDFSTGCKEAVKWGPCVKGAIQNSTRLIAVIKKYKPVAVMHFAARISAGESVKNPAAFYETNVTGTCKLLDACLKTGVRRFIFSSSAAVYGIPSKTPIQENSTTKPINPYGETKLIIEWMLESYRRAYGMEYMALRYFNAAGADADGEIGCLQKTPTNLIPIIMNVLSGKQKKLEIYGKDYNTPDGTPIRDYIHVSDLADAHVKALQFLLKNGGGESLNLGSGKGYSVMEVLKAAELVSHKKIPVVECPRRVGDPPILIADSKKARQLLHWKPQCEKINVIVETAYKWAFREEMR